MIKIVFAGAVERIYEETRGGRTNQYVVVTDDSGKFPNTLRFKVRGVMPECNEGDEVRVDAFLDGRKWQKEDGTVMYFTDLTIDKLEVTQSAGTAGTDGSKPVMATNWKELLALGEAYGEEKPTVTTRCETYKKKIGGRKFESADWQKLADEIVAAHADAADADDDSDMPF